MEIKGYRIIQEISRGPVTTVFRARQTALDRDVLLKVLNIQWNQDAEFLERFRREARISAKLNHPNIAAIYDFGTDGAYFYIAMEYIDGKNLKELIDLSYPLPFTTILDYTRQICSGLAFAHEQGVIHRDIKPTNILVSAKGGLKITDFGLAKVSDLPSITEQGTGIGTPAYMSPEQALGRKIVASSDYFSLGSTLYEMCSGTAPFKGDNIAETITYVTRKNPKSLSSLNNSIPLWYEHYISQLIHKDSAKRPESLYPFVTRIEAEQTPEKQDPSKIFSRNSKPYSSFSPAQAVPHRRTFNKAWVVILPLVMAVGIAIYNGSSSVSSEQDILEEKIQITASVPLEPLSNSEKPDSGLHRLANKLAGRADESETKQKSNLLRHAVQKDIADTMVEEKYKSEALLHIVCVPWAEVYLDGKYIDTTPIDSPVRLTPGSYLIELKNPTFQTYRQVLKVSTAVNETLNVSLKSDEGYLMVQAAPWADIYLNDTYFETTPLRQPLKIDAGRHILRLSNPGYRAIVDTIYIKPGEALEKNYKF